MSVALQGRIARAAPDGSSSLSAAITQAASPGGVVIDVGCGTGRALPALRQAIDLTADPAMGQCVHPTAGPSQGVITPLAPSGVLGHC